jgi:hypothetical protein
MCQPPRGEQSGVLNLLGDQVRVSLHLSMHRGVPNVFTVLERGRGPIEIIVQYNQ